MHFQEEALRREALTANSARPLMVQIPQRTVKKKKKGAQVQHSANSLTPGNA